ncbi:hypothetical protein M1L60_29620 [Actinoplanes sp. TRM 88003]|uniref:Uncharacterized protein n=1 Tax=Paractinoplanes aksuensis TaxID=2939490 RepID=A0ABT1DVB3_9ACTN|nr:hypothetical protein [Actinoplanes aksuensis]MCO8274763.1 hypothetical protein [Actinoplanes aksuensis]
MSGPLNRLLEHVLEGEPELGDEVDAVFRRAAKLRRRRTQAVLLAGAGTAGLIVALGYLLTATLLDPPPATMTTSTAVVTTAPSPPPAPAPTVTDRVLEVVEPLIEGRQLTVVPASQRRGDGWREYGIADDQGRARGTVQVAVFDVRKKWCFPVAAEPDACARADHAGDLEFVRYDDVSDPDRQVRQTLARRIDGNRVLAVMAAGETDAGTQRGKPGLTGAQVEQVATDDRVLAAFGKAENCDDGCPAFATPVR